MDVVQAERRLASVVDRPRSRQRPDLPDQFRQVGALHVLHHQEMRLADRTGVVSMDDVWDATAG